MNTVNTCSPGLYTEISMALGERYYGREQRCCIPFVSPMSKEERERCLMFAHASVLLRRRLAQLSGVHEQVLAALASIGDIDGQSLTQLYMLASSEFRRLGRQDLMIAFGDFTRLQNRAGWPSPVPVVSVSATRGIRRLRRDPRASSQGSRRSTRIAESTRRR